MGPELDLDTIIEGTDLPALTRQVTQEHVNLYAQASRDFNPIHLDPEFARKARLPGTIAHGMLILAYVSGYMTGYFGLNWLTGGNLNIRFKAAARPSDTLTISGKIIKIVKDRASTKIVCDVICRNQNNEPVITGEATINRRGT